jgi:hypothetical protein
VVTTEQAREFADQHGFPYFETSAKQYVNIDEVFTEMSKNVLERILMGKIPAEGEPGVKLGDLETTFHSSQKSLSITKRVPGGSCCGIN